jgi:ubiquinone/menaquinone biosynthesis C-methylase UbiE
MSMERFAASHYENMRVVRGYGAMNELLPPEEKLFEIYRDDIRDHRVLDLGCGGGRTTARLHALAKDYVGLDYSSAMVECCRRRYPGVNFVRGDAANLTMFDAASFDFVLFSYNGIDTMSHANRLRVLAEVRRVLVPDGLFVFSSHNIERRSIVVAFDRSAPLRLHALARTIKHVISYFKVRHMQVNTDTYSILSDPLAGFKQLMYYISKTNQIIQLNDNGFVDIYCLDEFGRPSANGNIDHQSRWFYYVCRKPDAFSRPVET